MSECCKNHPPMVYSRESLDAAYRPDLADEPMKLTPGEWCWHKGHFACRLPNGLLNLLPVQPPYGNDPNGWVFTSSNDEKPTLSPSIDAKSPHRGKGWHGHLLNGRFVSC